MVKEVEEEEKIENGEEEEGKVEEGEKEVQEKLKMGRRGGCETFINCSACLCSKPSFGVLW